MGGLVRAIKLVAGGWRLPGDLSSEIDPFSADLQMQDPMGLLIALTGWRSNGQALHLEAFTINSFQSVYSKLSDLPLPEGAVLIQAHGLRRSLRQVARLSRERHRCPLVIVSGTSEKTHDLGGRRGDLRDPLGDWGDRVGGTPTFEWRKGESNEVRHETVAVLRFGARWGLRL